MLGAVMVAAVCVAVPAAAALEGRKGAVGEVAIFYYPWYSTPARDGHWAHWYVEGNGRHVLSPTFYPRRGLYSSSNPKIVSAHMREIRSAGVSTVVVSWWGERSPEAARLPLVAGAARQHGLRVAIHLEPYRGRTPARAAQAIRELAGQGYVDFYVYEAERDPDGEWHEALEPLEGVRVFGHTTLVGSARASGFDGVYTYDVLTWRGAMFKRLCAQARQLGLLCAPSVGPGFDARLMADHIGFRDRRRGETYDAMWRSAIDAGPDVVTITSYNEWQEGTQIEPARSQVGRHGYDGAWGRRGLRAQTAYLDATARWSRELVATTRR